MRRFSALESSESSEIIAEITPSVRTLAMMRSLKSVAHWPAPPGGLVSSRKTTSCGQNNAKKKNHPPVHPFYRWYKHQTCGGLWHCFTHKKTVDGPANRTAPPSSDA